MAAKQNSLFRLAAAKECKGQSFDQLKMADPSTTSPSIAASGKFVAAGHGDNKGNVIVLSSNFQEYKRQAEHPVIQAHNGPIVDLAFSPHNDLMLATAGKDNSVKVWNLPAGGVTANISSATATFSDIDNINSISWHPTVADIIAVATKGKLVVLDVAAKAVKYTIPLPASAPAGGDLLHVCWNVDGSRLAVTGKNSVIYLVDPRKQQQLDGAISVGELRTQASVWIGKDSSILLVLGLDRSRTPMYSMLDMKDPSKPIASSTLPFSSGYLIYHYDVDTELLFISVRGSMQVSIFDMSNRLLEQSSSFSFKVGLKGFTALRKHGLDIFNHEINRLYGLSDKSIEPFSIVVPRKNAGFHIELYPLTASLTPSNTTEAYYAGTDKTPSLYQISDAAADQKEQARVEQKMAELKVVEEKKQAARTYTASATRKQLEQVFASSVFKHCRSSEPNSKEAYYYMIQPYAKSLPLGRNIKVNEKYFAYPWRTGAGSAIAVFDHKQLGRCPTTVPLVRGHKSQVTCFDLSSFDSSLIATGSEEGNILLFRIPEGGLKSDLDVGSALQNIETNGKVTAVRFHPYAANVLVSVQSGMEGTYISFYDFKDEKKVEQKIELKLHKEPVFDIAFSQDGFTIATTSRDGKVRVINPLDSTISHTFDVPEGKRDTQVLWINSHVLLTVGYGAMSKRSMSLFDLKCATPTKPLTTFDLSSSTSTALPFYDEDSCVLFIASAGGRVINSFNVNPKQSPYLEQLNEWMSASDITGWAFFPKTCCDVKKVETAKAVKLTKDTAVPLSFTVPRKRLEYFQDDIYSVTRSPEPQYTSAEWFAGTQKEPQYVSLQPAGMLELSKAPKEALTEGQKKYQSFLEQKAKEQQEKPKGATGHATEQEVRAHFQKIAASSATTKNRWDAPQEAGNDVDDSEWD